MEEAFRNFFIGTCNEAVKWGPAFLVLLVILYILYKLVLKLGNSVGLKIIGALEKPSMALDKQATSMDKLTGSIQGYVNRDSNEHKEIIILQKVIREELKDLRGHMKEIKNSGTENRKI
jgi:hypothetical protein